MPFDTLGSAPPPLFKPGPSALSRLIVLSALALFLMLADARLQLAVPLRAALATVLYPAQWLALQPVQLARNAGGYLTELKTARQTQEAAQRRLAEQSVRAGQVEHLWLENAQLRALLALGERVQVPAQAAQVLYDATDAYSRRVVIDKGSMHGIVGGAPVLDEAGVMGQITRVYPLRSEVTLLIDRDQMISVLNTRSGTRSVAYGEPTQHGGLLELRYLPAGDDIEVGDLLSTSGLDQVFPPGLPVARVIDIDRQSDPSFARVRCLPLARLQQTRHVMVLTPVSELPAPHPPAAPDTASATETQEPASAAPQPPVRAPKHRPGGTP